MKNREEQLRDVINRLRLGEVPVDEAALAREVNRQVTASGGTGIKILIIFGVFLVVLLFHSFWATFGFHKFPYGMIVTGAVVMAGSILYQWRQTDYLADTLTLAFFACGYTLVASGMHALELGTARICAASMFIALLAAAGSRNYLHPFVAVAMFSTSAMVWLVSEKQMTGIHIFHLLVLLATTWLYLKEARALVRLRSRGNLYDPLRLGFSLTLLFINYWYAFFRTPYPSSGLPVNEPYWFSVPVALVILLLVRDVFRRFGLAGKRQAAGLALVLLLLVTTLGTPVLGASVLLLLFGFRNGYKLMTVIGLVAFIGAIGRYYYDLRMTLLLKSGCMAATGILLLVGYFLLLKQNASDEQRR